MARLITVARERLEQQTKSFVPSLTMVCTEKLRESQYSPEEINLPHLQRYWDIPRYICAGCKETIYSGDPRFLSTPLRERFTRFDPCVTQLSASGQLPRGTFRRTYIVSSPTWTFCATCLVLHSQDSHLESSEQCQCIACSASRRLWSEKKAIRWAKHHVAS